MPSVPQAIYDVAEGDYGLMTQLSSLHLAYATLFSTQAAVGFYARARRRIETALGCFFVFASYKLATAKV